MPPYRHGKRVHDRAEELTPKLKAKYGTRAKSVAYAIAQKQMKKEAFFSYSAGAHGKGLATNPVGKTQPASYTTAPRKGQKSAPTKHSDVPIETRARLRRVPSAALARRMQKAGGPTSPEGDAFAAVLEERGINPNLANTNLQMAKSTPNDLYYPRAKTAALKKEITLRPHQEEALTFADERGGRALFAHGTGTGKTLSSIATFERRKKEGKAKRALVILPASLQTNFKTQGVEKFTTSSHGAPGSGADYQIVSLEKFRKNPQDILAKANADTVIVDEIHRAKDAGTASFKALQEISKDVNVKSVIGLTGSLVSNHPKEFVPLIDIVSGDQPFGSQRAFSKKHVYKERIPGGFLQNPRHRLTLKNKLSLGKDADKYVHYVDHDDIGKDGLPELEMRDVRVEMSEEQQELYDYALSRLSAEARARIKSGLPPNQEEAKHIFSQIVKARQAANSIGTLSMKTPAEAAESTPKLKKILDDVEAHLKKTPDGQAVVFSNMVNGGARELVAGLRGRKIQTGLYTGANKDLGVTKDSRDADVAKFLRRRNRAIVITPAGNEGISLNNATFFAAADHHFNPEKNWQAIARARRFGGLSHRPVGNRKVEVNRYYSDPRQKSGFFGLTKKREVGVDEWIQRVADEKDRLNQELRDVVRSERIKKKLDKKK